MPAGIPVATVALNGARNAGILAAQIIGTGEKDVFDRVTSFKSELAKKVVTANAELAKVQFEYRTNGK
jgi:5-(carboxyamino)imidazole ribonucleotide mutase